MHPCQDCNVGFNKLTSFTVHQRKEQPRYPCFNCGKIFEAKKKFVYHLRDCLQQRRQRKHQESGSIIRFSDYKRLPIVTAKELDEKFDVYMERKFGGRDIFQNEKICKFCSKTFVMASDFAAHIREHYKSIPLDAAGVKSKFDFMNLMGLRIRDLTTDIDCSKSETGNKLINKVTECRVIIFGERCKICRKSFKCITDLDVHNKKYHSIHGRRKVTLVLKIGKEIMSKISLRKRYIERGVKAAFRSNCKRLKIRLDEMYKNLKCPSNVDGMQKHAATTSISAESSSNNEIQGPDWGCQVVRRQDNKAQSTMTSEKDRRAFHLHTDSKRQRSGNTICSGLGKEKELDTDKDADDSFHLHELNYATKTGTCDVKSRRIYADECFEIMQLSEPWKDEFIGGGDWYSAMKLEKDDQPSDDDCFCIGTFEPAAIPKEKTFWKDENYNDTLGSENDNCHEVSLHESPPIYKYSCDQKYQSDFSFPYDEKSYAFEVNNEIYEISDNGEDSYTRANEGIKKIYDYKDVGANLNLNYSRSMNHPKEEKSFELAEFENTKLVNAPNTYQEVLIKEEVMLDDYTFCINDVYPSSSHFNA